MDTKNIYNCYYKESSCGIGDFLRGSVFLKQALDQVGINFDIDFTFHPISKFLTTPSVVDYKVDDIIDIEKESKKDPAKYLQNLRTHTEKVLNLNQSSIFLLTNYSDCIFLHPLEFAKIGISQQAAEFFISRLKFTKEVYDSLDELNLPSKYNAVHFRCGDYELVRGGSGGDKRNNTDYKIDYYECLRKLDNIDNPVILADSNKLKSFLEEQGYKIGHKNSQHSAINPGSVNSIEYQDDKMLHVCLDMLIMSRANSIQTYSVYPWFSGFSFWTAKIHNVPIYNNMIGNI